MRGRTLNNAFVVLDEAQNTTPEQMKMFLTRLGFGSQMVVTGDITQVDLPAGASGLQLVTRVLDEIDDIHFARLTSDDVVRHSLVGRIVDAYTKYDAEQQARRTSAQQDDGANRAERRGHRPQDHKPPSDRREALVSIEINNESGVSRSTRRRCSVSPPTRSTTCTCTRTPSSRSCSSTRPRWSSCTCSGWTSPARPTC